MLTEQYEIVDFHKLIKELVKVVDLQVQEKAAVLSTALHAQRTNVYANEIQIKKLFYNLIDNALKYSAKDPHLFITTNNENEKLIIKIKDNGIGIAKEHQASVFDKFFRVKTGDLHQVKGFGLGLSYVKKIVKLHMATIQLQSEVGKGSTFILSFNLA